MRKGAPLPAFFVLLDDRSRVAGQHAKLPGLRGFLFFFAYCSVRISFEELPFIMLVLPCCTGPFAAAQTAQTPHALQQLWFLATGKWVEQHSLLPCAARWLPHTLQFI